MPRVAALAGVLALVVLVGAAPLPAARKDAFDSYINPVLNKAPLAEGVREVARVTAEEIGDHDRVLPGLPYAFLIVKTNQGRNAKLLVQAGRQKTDGERSLPILLVERYVTYKEGEEETITARGQGLSLYPGFRLSLDLGQVVPEELGGDLRFVVEGDKVHLEPVGKAKLYLVTKALPDAGPKKGPKVVVKDPFEPRYFNGAYRLYDDGRRSGRLVLKVDEENNVTGAFYSDKDGQKYEVRGRVGNPPHSIQFTVVLPRTEQTFTGWLFTGDGSVLTGSSRMLNREAGFYATRIDQE
jgi:hypothetical protein